MIFDQKIEINIINCMECLFKTMECGTLAEKLLVGITCSPHKPSVYIIIFKIVKHINYGANLHQMDDHVEKLNQI